MGGRTPALQTMLINCNEADFDQSAKSLSSSALIQMITSLQTEMRSEQTQFDRLTRQLAMVPDKTSRQYKAISADLMSSQTRLTGLMNKSMKCYNMQSTKLSAQSTPDVRKENSNYNSSPISTPQTNGRTDDVNNERIRPSKSVENFNEVPENSRVKQRPSIQDLRKMFGAEEDIKQSNRRFVENVAKTNASVTNSNSNMNNSNSGRLSASPHVKVLRTTSPDSGNKNSKIQSSSNSNVSPTKSQSPTKFQSNFTQLKNGNDVKIDSVKPVENITKSSFTVELKSPQVKAMETRNNDAKSPVARTNSSVDRTDGKISHKISPNVTKNVVQEELVTKTHSNKIQSVNSRPKSQNYPSDDPAINSELMAALADLKKSKPPSSPSAKDDGKISEVEDKHMFVSSVKLKSTPSKVESEKKIDVSKDSKESSPAKHDRNIPSPKAPSNNAASPHTPSPNQHTPVTILSRKKSDTKTETETITPISSTPVNVAPNHSVPDGVVSPNVRMGSPGVDGLPPDEDDLVQPRVHMTQWDPVKLLKQLYKIELRQETETDLSYQMITMEGFMEKLPMGKKKSTLLKTWKRRYFKTCDGMLHYYESSKGGQPSMSVKLMGGKVETLDNRILGIDDSSGHYLMLRCPTEREFDDWKAALESQTLDNSKAIYVRPVLSSPPHLTKKIVIIDIGSVSIRAGVLGQKASLPTLFFPTIVAVNKSTGEKIAGFDAYKPDVRAQSDLVSPVQPSCNAQKPNRKPFNIDLECLPTIFTKIFTDLSINSSEYAVLLSTPQNFSPQIKEKVLDMLVREYRSPAVCMVPQALLSIYSYKATSGIIVDIGERLEIMAIADGYVVEGGVNRKAYGAGKVCESLTASLCEGRYHFYTPTEALITRHVLEQSCYISNNYDVDKKSCLANPDKYKKTVPLQQFDLPPDTYTEVTHDAGTFRSCEGFFNPSLWGADFPTLQTLVHKAIQMCPMDTRRDMARSIYLSGGSSIVPGFAERLTQELTNLVPPRLKILVHASPQRYHAAYIGACTLAEQKFFEPSCITREEWLANGSKTLSKWATPT